MSRRFALSVVALAMAACGTRDAATTGASAPSSATLSRASATTTASAAASEAAAIATLPSASASASATAGAVEHLPSHGLSVAISAEGVSIATPAGHVGAGCKGDTGVTVARTHDALIDAAAITRCVRALKSAPALVDASDATITAAPSVAYGDVIALIDALRTDGHGDLFPDIRFSMPTAPNATPSAGAPAPPPLFTIKHTSVSSLGNPRNDPPVILITKSALRIADEDASLVDFNGVTDLATFGLPVSAKRAGRDDTLIVPLADDLARRRSTVKSVGKEEPLEAMIAADGGTPYRVLFEVLSTLTASGFGRYHFMVVTKR